MIPNKHTQDIIQAFEKRNIVLLKKLIEIYPIQSNIDHRFVSHYSAKQKLISGHLDDSFEELKSALNKYGPHVCLLADLVAVSYLLNDLKSMDLYTEYLNLEFVKIKSKLHIDTLVRTTILIGKIKEFKGEVYSADQLYEEAYQIAPDNALFLKAAAQVLRIKSFLGKADEVANIYNAITSRKIGVDESDFEVNHSLLLMEIRLFGVSTALARLEKVLHSSLPEYDKRQMVCHFLEEIFWNGQDIDKEMLSKITSNIKFDALNRYEYLIFSQFIKDLTADNLEECVAVLDELKRLVFLIKITADSHLKEACKKKLVFHLQGLTRENRGLLEKKWSAILNHSEKIIIKLNLNNEEILVSGHIYRGQKARLLIKILSSFKRNSYIASEEVVLNLFDIKYYNESTYHRLRMTVSRLNKELKNTGGIMKLFTLKYTQLELASNVELIFNE